MPVLLVTIVLVSVNVAFNFVPVFLDCGGDLYTASIE